MVEVIVDHDVAHLLRSFVGERFVAFDGRHRATVRVVSADEAAGMLAGFGARAEVVGPPEVCERLAVIGSELTARYATGSTR